MKTIKIYSRKTLERTGFKKYPFKEITQYTIVYNHQEIKNHYELMDNPRLRIKFNKILETRSWKKLEIFISKLGRTDAEKWLKEQLKIIYDYQLNIESDEIIKKLNK